jgi:hypothetical protein
MKLSEKVRSISAKVGMGAAVLGASTVAAFATSSGPSGGR